MITVTIEGLDKIKKAGETTVQWQEICRNKIKDEMRFFGEAVVGTSREKFLSGRPGLNVVTGRLRSSINYLVSTIKQGYSVEVGTNVPYAPVHEFGDRRGFIRPRPFLKPAVEAEYGGLVDHLDKVLKQFADTPLGQ